MCVCQFRRGGVDGLLCDLAERRAREVSGEGDQDRRDRGGRVRLRPPQGPGEEVSSTFTRVLAPRVALVLGLPNGVSRVVQVGTTSGSSTAVMRRSLDLDMLMASLGVELEGVFSASDR